MNATRLGRSVTRAVTRYMLDLLVGPLALGDVFDHAEHVFVGGALDDVQARVTIRVLPLCVLQFVLR